MQTIIRGELKIAQNAYYFKTAGNFSLDYVLKSYGEIHSYSSVLLHVVKDKILSNNIVERNHMNSHLDSWYVSSVLSAAQQPQRTLFSPM